MEGARVGIGEPAAQFFGGVPRVRSRLRGGAMPAGALGVDVGQDRLAAFEAVGELLVCLRASETLGALMWVGGAGMCANERDLGGVLAAREGGGAQVRADVRWRPGQFPFVNGPGVPTARRCSRRRLGLARA